MKSPIFTEISLTKLFFNNVKYHGKPRGIFLLLVRIAIFKDKIKGMPTDYKSRIFTGTFTQSQGGYCFWKKMRVLRKQSSQQWLVLLGISYLLR